MTVRILAQEVRILAQEVRVGDVVVFLGHPHLISRIDEQPDGKRFGWSNDDWCIALSDDWFARLDVQRVPVTT